MDTLTIPQMWLYLPRLAIRRELPMIRNIRTINRVEKSWDRGRHVGIVIGSLVSTGLRSQCQRLPVVLVTCQESRDSCHIPRP